VQEKIMGLNMPKKEELFYSPVIEWLKDNGFRAIQFRDEFVVGIPSLSMLGIQFIKPCIVGYKKEDDTEVLAVVEVRDSKQLLFDAIGRCAIYRKMGAYSYIAVPKEIGDEITDTSLYRDLGIGLLVIEGKEVKEKVKAESQIPQREEMRNILLSMVKFAIEQE
jgi:hypothetical protein